jgi:glycosyltransferase involved in cell wall biosynthesis
MDINGANILIDGISLQQLQTRGIKTYSLNLLEAYKGLCANPSILISQYSPMSDIGINADISTIFNKMNNYNYIKRLFPLWIKTIFGMSANADLLDIPTDLRTTKDNSFIYDANIYGSQECYKIANHLRFLGLKLKIATSSKVDIWHTSNLTPLNIKRAVRISTIHDIIPLALPDVTTWKPNIYNRLIRDTIKDSRLILCVSEYTKSDLMRFFDVSPDKLVVSYQPVSLTNEVIVEDTMVNRLRSLQIEYGQYILVVGTIEPRKNLKRLIKAYLSLLIEIPLVIVGAKGLRWDSELAQLDTKSNNVRILDYVSETDKYILYKGALFLAFPSLYEGFGLPAIEAMIAGVPVLTSSVSCLPEVCGDAALYVDPYDVQDIANKMTMMINDKQLRQRLIAAGYEKAKFFSMDNFVKGLKKAYSKI